jgi:hypothetical protein
MSDSKWIPVSERTPDLTSEETLWGARLSAPVIALFPSDWEVPPGMNIQAAYFGRYEDGEGGEWFTATDAQGGLDRCSSHGGASPTHWMPLPPTPTTTPTPSPQ